MEIVLIVAVDEKWAIGIDGDQPAYIGGDLKRFKQLTTGHAIVMGRKTFDALPKGALPNRRNIVMTREKELLLPGCEMAHSVDEVVKLCRNEEKLFVIGGGQIYKEFMPKADSLLLTKIHQTFAYADTWFPKIDPDQWISKDIGESLLDEKSGLEYHYETLERKRH